MKPKSGMRADPHVEESLQHRTIREVFHSWKHGSLVKLRAAQGPIIVLMFQQTLRSGGSGWRES